MIIKIKPEREKILPAIETKMFVANSLIVEIVI
jgi:hypothetical protein